MRYIDTKTNRSQTSFEVREGGVECAGMCFTGDIVLSKW